MRDGRQSQGQAGLMLIRPVDDDIERAGHFPSKNAAFSAILGCLTLLMFDTYFRVRDRAIAILAFRARHAAIRHITPYAPPKHHDYGYLCDAMTLAAAPYRLLDLKPRLSRYI